MAGTAVVVAEPPTMLVPGEVLGTLAVLATPEPTFVVVTVDGGTGALSPAIDGLGAVCEQADTAAVSAKARAARQARERRMERSSVVGRFSFEARRRPVRYARCGRHRSCSARRLPLSAALRRIAPHCAALRHTASAAPAAGVLCGY